MSTSSHTYVFYGHVMSPPEYEDDEAQEAFYERLDPFRDRPGKSLRATGATALLDVMSGEYLAVGRVLARSDQYGAFAETVTIPTDGITLYAMTADVFSALSSLGLPSPGAPRWHVLTHYR